MLSSTIITHIFDRESESPVHGKQFQRTLDRMREAESLGKHITYTMGYSNFSFELWIILHKEDWYTPLNYQHQYLAPLNRIFHEQFSDLHEYKQKDAFARILEKLSLYDVWSAIDRAKQITQQHKENGYILQHYKGYSYYKENPSLSVWQIVEKILLDCSLSQP